MVFKLLLRSSTFHNFVKVALTKNPKKRPTAERLLTVSIFLVLQNRKKAFIDWINGRPFSVPGGLHTFHVQKMLYKS